MNSQLPVTTFGTPPPPGGPPGSNALATNANEDSAKIKATSNPTIVMCRVMGNVGQLFYINWLLD
tara:strand:- start:762 stop:956 length:195 start_codon:yes stop_codon:yes gene_type:complete